MGTRLSDIIAKYNPYHSKVNGQFTSGPGGGAGMFISTIDGPGAGGSAGSRSTKKKPMTAQEALKAAGIKYLGGDSDVDTYKSMAEAKKACEEWTDYKPMTIKTPDGPLYVAFRPTVATKKKLGRKSVIDATPKAPYDPNVKIPHGDGPVREGFRRVETVGERKAFAAKAGIKAIPPAWTDLQVTKNIALANRSHGKQGLLAVGRDAKGRQQSLYSEFHSKHAKAEKFKRVRRLQAKLPALDRRLAIDAKTDSVAGSVMLMRKLGLRPGSGKNTGADKTAFGSTTLKVEHIKIANGVATLAFPSKKGGFTTLQTNDKAVISMLRAQMKGKASGDRLFDKVTEADTNAYLKKTVGAEFTQKDLRTSYGTSTAAAIVATMPRPTTPAALARAKKEVAKQVSELLGNTPTVALASYIAPEVFTGWES